ncbi:hypothetical protein Hypma_014945 [Hypsizygus marmoreus]|uniref:Uncharacterized protein n=1 Tax=Hypsizygus marmoreus TaxID=39966 RepID=A0A369K8I9_HYPMA|nr:hypothetical protein Hypma_014945 [Hypsizygus marmoreus]
MTNLRWADDPVHDMVNIDRSWSDPGKYVGRHIVPRIAKTYYFFQPLTYTAVPCKLPARNQSMTIVDTDGCLLARAIQDDLRVMGPLEAGFVQITAGNSSSTSVNFLGPSAGT